MGYMPLDGPIWQDALHASSSVRVHKASCSPNAGSGTSWCWSGPGEGGGAVCGMAGLQDARQRIGDAWHQGRHAVCIQWVLPVAQHRQQLGAHCTVPFLCRQAAVI